MEKLPELLDTEFDLRIRAELALAFDPEQAPGHLFRRASLLSRRSFQRTLVALVALGTGAGAVLAKRPPALVRGAIEHEYYERTLRGNFMASEKILSQMGLPEKQAIPGFTQLMRPCDIDGHLVYHLTTFIEKGGMVTVFAFDQAVALDDTQGWWGNVYWQVLRSRSDKPLVMVAQRERALQLARVSFGKP